VGAGGTRRLLRRHPQGLHQAPAAGPQCRTVRPQRCPARTTCSPLRRSNRRAAAGTVGRPASQPRCRLALLPRRALATSTLAEGSRADPPLSLTSSSAAAAAAATSPRLRSTLSRAEDRALSRTAGTTAMTTTVDMGMATTRSREEATAAGVGAVPVAAAAAVEAVGDRIDAKR
jgi:hypothetical protein